MSEEKTHPMIFEKLALMIAEVDSIGKDRKVESGPARFNFRGIDQIYNTVHEMFAEHGVFPVARILEHAQSERVSGSGGKLYVCTLKVAYTLYAKDGSSVVTEAIGEAMDSGDKAANKAMSYAYKYAMMQLLCIPTEAIDGDRETYDQSKVDTSAQKLQDEIAARQKPADWKGGTLPLQDKPIQMLAAKEVQDLTDRAKNAPIGQVEVIEREVNALSIREKTLGQNDAREIRNILLTRMVINFTGSRLAGVVQRLPMYQKQGLVTIAHANALISIWKSKAGSEVEGAAADVVAAEQDQTPQEGTQENA